MKFTREIKAAVLVIISILFFIWGYSYLKGKDLFSNYKTVYAEYDNVEGLSKSAPVTINGLTIGKVSDISFINAKGKILVTMQLKNDFPFSKSSVAKIYEPGFMAGKQIMIEPTYKNINSVLDSKTKESLKNSSANLDATIVEFKGASKNVNEMLADNKQKIKSTITNIDKASANFAKVSDSISKINISNTVKKLENTLANVDKILLDVQSGKGTLGKLAKDEGLYNNFSKTSKELELLLQDLRLNPTRYVNVSLFGKKNKPYKAPAADSDKK